MPVPAGRGQGRHRVEPVVGEAQRVGDGLCSSAETTAVVLRRRRPSAIRPARSQLTGPSPPPDEHLLQVRRGSRAPPGRRPRRPSRRGRAWRAAPPSGPLVAGAGAVARRVNPNGTPLTVPPCPAPSGCGATCAPTLTPGAPAVHANRGRAGSAPGVAGFAAAEAGLRVAVTGAAAGLGALLAARLVDRPGGRARWSGSTRPPGGRARGDVAPRRRARPGAAGRAQGRRRAWCTSPRCRDDARRPRAPAHRQRARDRDRAHRGPGGRDSAGGAALPAPPCSARAADNPVPLPDGPPGLGRRGRLAGRRPGRGRAAGGQHPARPTPALAVTVLRAAPVVGPASTSRCCATSSRPGCCAVRGTRPLWQLVPRRRPGRRPRAGRARGGHRGSSRSRAPGWLERRRGARRHPPAPPRAARRGGLRRGGAAAPARGHLGPGGRAGLPGAPLGGGPHRGCSPPAGPRGTTTTPRCAPTSTPSPRPAASRTAGRAAAGAGATVALVGTAALVRRARRRRQR